MSSSTQRNLTLTEELERLEQSITLTLQEIDSNFSRAHRIVTTSILPIVEQYAEHSKDVWEGAKFWKQFFEASANVSLSGYEEMPNEDTTTTTDHEQTVTEDSTNMTQTSLDDEAVSYQTPSSEHLGLGHQLHHDESELDISALTISPSHSTPRPRAYVKGGETPTTGGYPAGYSEDEPDRAGYDDSALPEGNNDSGLVTPGRHTNETPMSSPFIPPPTISRTTQPSTSKRPNTNKYQKPTDPVLHHILDKTYRVQATPLSKTYKPTKFSVSTPKEKTSDNKKLNYDDSPISSPELEAPKLSEELFAYRGWKGAGPNTPGTNRKAYRRSPQKRTPKPGISVLTPAKPRLSLLSKDKKKKTTTGGWESDEDNFDDDDDEDTAAALGFSPPKTMQFHIPHSRLMKTPAKEASKRIVSDLLATAGGGTGTTSDDMTDDFYNKYRAVADEEHSPTVVRSGGRLEDDTF
ncbi:conserved hypothetical protein [Talaromyces stipitatus ATCC 10500]|uniref:DASH complex subunit ASK1 n=1 Tax=Talaromyces stipitatus (strain ATCC 10500 / CBS 375.48 / QM 6759 / NRRL 1006) TaxID=441959 RepID=B8M2F1_TALSN|nr:uncharacterized protein TSTA_088510 [Talaromyces stipitatus ATCC 10500]EED21615.1 conserved hypothetical protein [Talaromyces stipitatus ATCC 10500]